MVDPDTAITDAGLAFADAFDDHVHYNAQGTAALVDAFFGQFADVGFSNGGVPALGSGESLVIQAEDALVNGANVVEGTQFAPVGDAFVDFLTPAGEDLTFAVVSDGGTADIAFTYALFQTLPDRTMALEVNGVTLEAPVTFEALSTSMGDWREAVASVTLDEGLNVIKLIATGISGPNIDQIAVTMTSEPPIHNTITLQAEDAAIFGADVVSNTSGAEGGAFVDYKAASGDAITWAVDASAAGPVDIDIRYALAAPTPRVMALEINGVVVDDAVTFTQVSSSWSDWGTLSLSAELAQGANSIRLLATGDSGPNVDAITLTGLGLSEGDGAPQFGTISDGVDTLEPGETDVPRDVVISVDLTPADPGDAIDPASVTADTVKLVRSDTGGGFGLGQHHRRGRRDQPHAARTAGREYGLQLRHRRCAQP